MTEERARYLAGEAGVELVDDARAELDGVRSLLAEESTWAEPPSWLEDAVVVAVATAAGEGWRASGAPTPSPIRRRRLASVYRPALLVAAAAAVAIAAGVVVTSWDGGPSTSSEALSVELEPTELAPAASGAATLTRTDDGWQIELRATGLPRRDGGQFYEAWLRNADGVLVPIGTFNEAGHVVLWAGVRPADFPTLTITEEEADGDPASSGRRVLVGTIDVP